MKVRIGVGLSSGHQVASTSEFVDIVDILEDLSFDSLWMSDTTAGPAFDPHTALAFAAGRTTRLKFGTAVAVLPGREPILLAKQISLLDRLSDGRFVPTFGLGTPRGIDRPPFRMGHAERVRSFEENLATLRRLWAGGEGVPHPDGGAPATIDPRPSSQLDVWLGGRSAEALERVGRLGDGWLGSFQTPEEGGRARAVALAAAADAGRTIDEGHFGTTIYYTRSRRSPSAERTVLGAMDYCGCLAPSAGRAEPIAAHHPMEAMFPEGEDELVTLIGRHVDHGLTKFVLIPAERPDDWDDELSWLRAVVAQLET
jgi:probable F420-dependent oxidoreductase